MSKPVNRPHTTKLEALRAAEVQARQAVREAELKATAARSAAEQAEQAAINAHNSGNPDAAEKALDLAEAESRRAGRAVQGAQQRVAEAQAAIRQYEGTNAQALIDECAADAEAVVERLADGRQKILEASAAWYALAQKVSDHLKASGVQASGNMPHSHELHEVARMLRSVGDTITSPMPHGRNQKFVEQNERVAQAIKAERTRTPEAA